MKQFFLNIAGKFKRKPLLYGGLAVVVLWVFGKELRKLFDWIRHRVESKATTKSVREKVAQDSGSSSKTVVATVREETCKGVASAVFAAMHEKYFGFIPRSWVGSKEDGDEVVKELNSLKNGLEAKYVSSYYFEKYGERLRPKIISMESSAINFFEAGIKSIRPEIWNNIS